MEAQGIIILDPLQTAAAIMVKDSVIRNLVIENSPCHHLNLMRVTLKTLFTLINKIQWTIPNLMINMVISPKNWVEVCPHLIK